MKERGKDNSSPRTLPGGETLASGLAVAALALVAGFISLPILSLVVWTISENPASHGLSRGAGRACS